jgi:Co/Zn/Cd efflux system component
MALFHLGAGAAVAAGGFIAGSQALKADALDFLGIGSIAALALAGIGRDHAWRARAALVQAVVQGLLCFLIIFAALYRMTGTRIPEPAEMASFALAAFTANAAFAWLVLKDHGRSVDAAAVWRQGRAELIEDAAILAAAAIVWLSQAVWADSLVAAAIAAPLLRSSWTTMLDARGTLAGANLKRRARH